MKIVLAGLALLTGGAAVVQPPTEAPMDFRIELEQLTNGWSPNCTAGCSWTRASFKCDTTCPTVIDDHGIVTTSEPRPETVAFSFRVEAVPGGWRATSNSGTGWKELSYGCGTGLCRAVITSSGVTGAR